MRRSVLPGIIFSAFCTLQFSNATDNNFNGNLKNSGAHSKSFNNRPNSGLVSFNSDEDKLRVDWAVTIPFISIPVEQKLGENGHPPPLLNVNTKALGIVGLITTLFSVISPLLSKKHPHYNYRSEDSSQWLEMGNTMNEVFFGNNYIAPCMQRVVCSMVSVATHSGNPTSTDKIIDGISSHRWFNDVTNGTIIQDAVAVGRTGNQDCSRVYKDCLIAPKLLKSVIKEFGIM